MKAIQHTNQSFCSNIQRMLGIVVMMVMAVGDVWGQTPITSLSDITDQGGNYIITKDISGGTAGVSTFNGTLEAAIDPATKMPYRIKNLTAPLFTTLTGTVKNLVIESVSISQSGMVGAIACTANGSARVYNVGILGGTVESTGTSTANNATDCCGGLVGLLDGNSNASNAPRVVNCYSYADITGGNRVGGIVGYNNYGTTSADNKRRSMVFACMFYGDITGGNSIAPIYNGTNIVNRDANGVSNFNYFRLEAPYVQPTGVTYNCALGAEDRFLQRFEFYRHLLNGRRELAGWWTTGTYSKSEMLKWVLLPDSIGTAHPYPVLMQQGKYPSVVNIDAANAQENQPRNQGGKLGTLTVNIQMDDTNDNTVPFHHPTNASITTTQLTLNITDKDFDHFNFNYYKVQLPYYNDVGTKNYTGNRVVTGWKIVSITGGTPGTFSTSTADAPSWNFADRNCTNKDLYGTNGSNRIFNQGAYWDVPEGVTAITIEPYWAKAAFLADSYADVVYNTAMGTAYNVPNVGGGQKYTNGNSYSIAGENQVVYTTMGNAIGTGALNPQSSNSVYDYAVVLVGNYHHYYSSNSTIGGSNPYTIMSIDLDNDNEPDYCYIMRNDGRNQTHPVRVDFLNIPGLGMAQKSTGGTGSYNFGILQPIGWFESTNTSLFRVTQFEYDRTNRVAAPYIVQGGVIEQWVSGQNNNVANKTTYFLVGGNVWFKEFHRGTHQDNTYKSKHPPVSVTGGDYDEFYLTGLYRGDVVNYEDNAECYINGGRFGTVAGAAMEGIGKANGDGNTGNITWQVQNADIREFYAGGINAAKPVTGNLSTTITGGYIELYCGGPKFGDMSTGKTVTTTATGCTFGTFFGAGYGGNSYSRQAPRNHNNIINFPHNDNQAGNDASWNAWLSRFYTQSYNSTYGGVSTQFNYQFIPMSGNADNCARIFVEYVKFSLATTHSITSTLNECTITGNFYGGGSLGKVDGPVVSTLESCTVNGNVFGAGFSASLPTVEVDGLGFRVEPYYYTDLGTYRKGVKGSTTIYNWESMAPGSTPPVNINTDLHILYTTENLSTSNLGSVSGNVELILKGNTKVGTLLENGTLKPNTGNVYGGGDESHVTKRTGEQDSGNTTVKLQEGAKVLGNVYGGGNNGPVEGDSQVIIQDETNTTNEP